MRDGAIRGVPDPNEVNNDVIPGGLDLHIFHCYTVPKQHCHACVANLL